MDQTTPRIDFEADFPPELKDLILVLLQENLYLCPLWMQRVEVAYRPHSADDFCLQWVLNRDYRKAYLNIAPTFLTELKSMQREMLIHEIIHSYTIPLKTAAFEALKDCEIEDPVYSVVTRQLDRVMEQVTQDFAYAISRKSNA
jgi:hypothetical protein